MKKKLLSLTMVAALTVALSVPAFAATDIALETSQESVQTDVLNQDAGTTYFVDDENYDGPVGAKTNVWADGQIVEEVKVTATKASEFEITIPKEIVMDGATKAADYEVTVKGDIAGDQKITVTPDPSFQLNEDGNKAPVTCTVTQDDVTFASAEIVDPGKTVPGSLAAPDLTAGKWSGKFAFTIVYQ